MTNNLRLSPLKKYLTALFVTHMLANVTFNNGDSV